MQTISISAQINAPQNQVWSMYTSPDHITQWNFASPDWCCPSATNDLQVGGRYLARMEAKDKSFGFDFEAYYTEVNKPNRLCYTMGVEATDGRNVTVDFYTTGNQTTVEVVFEPETENDIEMQRNGWQAILNNFKAYCEKQS